MRVDQWYNASKFVQMLRKNGRLWLLLAIAATLGVTTGAPSNATSANDPSLALTSGGNAVTTATDGSTINSVATAPITLNGQTNQTITQVWDKSTLRFGAGSITAPEGWTVEYTTNGTTWSSTAPADLTTVTGVRTTGSVESVGYANGLQSSISNAQSTIKPATVGSLSVSSGGDGYDVFFDDARTKIFNVFHHGTVGFSNNKINCHNLTNGTVCAGYPMSMPHNLGTNDRSPGLSVGDKVWVPAGYGSNPGGGFACFLVAGGLCPTSFVSLTTNVNIDAYNNVVNITRVGQYLFTINLKDGKVLCLDTSTSSACSTMPAGGFDLGIGVTRPISSSVITVGTRIYAHDGNGDVGCLDTATWALCTNWSTPWTAANIIHPFPLPDANGAILGICAFLVSSAVCIDENKASITTPASLNTARATIPEDATGNSAIYGYNNTPQVAGSRVYWSNMLWHNSQPNAKLTCWDASLNNGSGGICTFTTTSLNYVQDETYAITVDPDNANCVWTNDDNGNIESFDMVTGTANCPVPTDAVVEIPYNVAAPRFSCAEVGRIRQWDSITVDAPVGVTKSTLKITVKRNGISLVGWSNRNPDSNGRLDLSSLPVSATGTQPKFEITAPGLTTAQAADITGEVKYLSDAPQLCLNLTPLAYCPTGVGVAPSATLTRPADTVQISVTNTASSASQTFADSESVSRSSIANCTGNVNGNVSRSTGSGPVAIANGTVVLKDSNNTIVASTTTDSSGNYSFSVMYPHAYTVAYVDRSQAATVTANATTTKNFTLTVAPPASQAVTNTTAQNVAVTTQINATADAATSIDSSSLQIRAGAGSYSGSVNVPNEGTWSVVNGQLQFTPVVGFHGTTTAIDYRVADGFGTTTASTATVTVSRSTMAAVDDSESGVSGQTLTLTGSATSGNVPIEQGSVVMRDGSSGSFAGTLSVPGVGTFEASSTDNNVTFRSTGGWTGTKSVTYRISDVAGQTATATLTVTMSAFAVSGSADTVKQSVAGVLPVKGAPAGATLSVPASVKNVASMSVLSASEIRVVPTPGFSGIIRVPVTATVGSTSATTEVVLTVLPDPTPRVVMKNGHNGSSLTWRASPTPTVTGYIVSLNGRVLCTTNAVDRSCTTDKFLGRASRITVTAIGGDDTRSTATKAVMPEQCRIVQTINFAPDSARVTARAEKTIRDFVDQVKKQKLGGVCLIGHTDSRGSVMSNNVLSYFRATNVFSRIEDRLPGSVDVTLDYSGEWRPRATNSTQRGMKINRRVDLGVTP